MRIIGIQDKLAVIRNQYQATWFLCTQHKRAWFMIIINITSTQQSSVWQTHLTSPHPSTPSSSWHMAGVALFACERIGLCTSWGITGVCEWADWEPGCLGWVWIRCFSVRLHARCDGTEWMERLSKSWGNNDWRDDRFESRLSSPLEHRRWFSRVVNNNDAPSFYVWSPALSIEPRSRLLPAHNILVSLAGGRVAHNSSD